jgi:hypothetical protein
VRDALARARIRPERPVQYRAPGSRPAHGQVRAEITELKHRNGSHDEL